MGTGQQDKFNALVHRYLLGIANEDETLELEAFLETSEDLRREFVRASQLDVIGRGAAIEQSVGDGVLPLLGSSVQKEETRSKRSRIWAYRWMLGAAAALLLAFFLWPKADPCLATIVSSENAAWESSLPTLPGDELRAGTLNLRAGMATLRFGKGAELLLEAPATLELISEMRCRLESGAAVVHVPETSIGFVVESPGGYAEDFGTSFAIHVRDDDRQSDFELIEGEIEVHHDGSGDSVRLTNAGAAVVVSAAAIRRVEPAAPEEVEGHGVQSSLRQKVVVLGTEGRCGTAMPRFEKRWKFIDPTILSVKRSNTGKWDYRSFFSFDTSGLDLVQIEKVRLRLNLLPSRRGHASRLPKVNRFGIYGLTNEAKENWKIESRWEASPGPEDGVLLGTFDVERSQTRGVFGIQGQDLLEFIKNHRSKTVTFILCRETTQIEGVGPGLTHMFASDSHPESVGPQLEITLK